MGMAENLKALMAADVAATVLDVSATLTYARDTVVGTLSPVGKGDNIDPEGIIQTADAEFVAVASLFASVPPIRAVVDVDGIKYAVESIIEDPAAVTLRLKRGP